MVLVFGSKVRGHEFGLGQGGFRVYGFRLER